MDMRNEISAAKAELRLFAKKFDPLLRPEHLMPLVKAMDLLDSALRLLALSGNRRTGSRSEGE